MGTKEKTTALNIAPDVIVQGRDTMCTLSIPREARTGIRGLVNVRTENKRRPVFGIACLYISFSLATVLTWYALLTMIVSLFVTVDVTSAELIRAAIIGSAVIAVSLSGIIIGRKMEV